MEAADEVLALRQVDPRLAADRRVDLCDEARRHGRPGDPAEIGRGDEPGRVRRAAAAECNDRAAAVEAQLLPEPVDGGERLCLFARRKLVRLREPRAERELRVHPVDACNLRVRHERYGAVSGEELTESPECTTLDVYARGSENDVVHVLRNHVGDAGVQRPALLVQTAERRFVLCERAVASPDALPTGVDVDVEPDRQRVGERVPHGRRCHCAAAECEHDRLLLERAEGGLPLLAEDLRDRLARRRLDEMVGVCAAELAGCSGLARAHEADDRDVLLQIRSR